MFMGMNITYFSFLISGQMTFMILQSGGAAAVFCRVFANIYHPPQPITTGAVDPLAGGGPGSVDIVGPAAVASHLLAMVNQNTLKEKTSSGMQGVNNEWCTLLHLLGCCLLSQAHLQSSWGSIEKKVNEAISCFF
uniref:Uncharacterized protein n=2 Tax=Lactuca sativa TaxID=4236 RepID=A0A9R1WEV5_LACSA|nr:hypothetical protein LSAT_V11C400207180 [Lactuca sativa]KAJ0225442.1 hypothetical protein LSAT_V11C100049350 [Lactuca sativa]